MAKRKRTKVVLNKHTCTLHTTHIIQLRPSVQGNIQICQPEGENNPPRGDKSGCFPTQRAVIVLLYFCQCFIGYFPCGGKLGCSAMFANVLQVISLVGENWVVRRGKIGVVRRGTIGLFPGSANFGKTSQLFYYHMTNLNSTKKYKQEEIIQLLDVLTENPKIE